MIKDKDIQKFFDVAMKDYYWICLFVCFVVGIFGGVFLLNVALN